MWFFPFVVLPAAHLLQFGRRLRATATPAAKDREPEIVLLRSFADDARELPPDPAPTWTPFPFLDRYFPPHTFEEALCRVLQRHGNVVAVGRPGERLPPLGARRIYLPTIDWQAPLLELLRTARLIVVVVGRTKGIRWELQHVGTPSLVAKTIFVFPSGTLPDHRDRMQRFEEHVLGVADGERRHLPRELPPGDDERSGTQERVLVAMVDAGRRVERYSKPWGDRDFSAGTVAAYEELLRPLLEAPGLMGPGGGPEQSAKR